MLEILLLVALIVVIVVFATRGKSTATGPSTGRALLESVLISFAYLLVFNGIWIIPLLNKDLGPGGAAGLSVVAFSLFFSLICFILSFIKISGGSKDKYKVVLIYIILSLVLMIILGLSGFFYTTSGLG